MHGEERRRIPRDIQRVDDEEVAVDRRSDESIREEICASLSSRSDLDTSDLQVQVEGGEVTLTGRVEDRDALWLAEDLVESVAGVSLVHNRLRPSDN